MGIVYFIFPETRGLGLEEVAQVFGEDVTRGYVAGETAIAAELENKPHVSHVDSLDLKST